MFEATELEEQTRKAAGADVALASDDELVAAVKSLEASRAMLEAAEAHVLGELDVRDVCGREFGSTLVNWLAHETKGDRGAIAARVKVAAALRWPLSEVDAALSDGRISFEHARVLVRAGNERVIDELADVQGEWLAGAGELPFKVWKHQLERWADLVDQDGPFDPNADLARNTLSITPIGGDGIRITGELHGELALGVKTRIEARAEQLWEQARRDREACPDLPLPSFATLRARAFDELTREANAETSSAPPVDLTMVWNAEEPDTLSDPGGELDLPAERLAHLLCDSQLTLVATNVVGVILNMGRRARLATRAQRRALTIRDGGCVFPGCGAPASWCDAHHVHHWDHDGDTDLCNLALLCRYHHGVTHRTGWTMTATEDQHFVWTTPSGATLHSQRHRGKPPPGT